MSLFSRSFWADAVLTYAAHFVILGCVLIAPRIVTRGEGINSLALYLLMQRLSSAMTFPLSLSLGTALARFLPMRSEDKGSQARWSVLAITIAFVVSGVFVLVMLSFPSVTAKLLLGDARYYTYVVPFSILLMGNVLHPVVFGHYRGAMQMKAASLIQAIDLGLAQITPLLFLKRLGLANAIGLIGVLMLATEAIFTLPLLWTWLRTQGEKSWVGEAWRSMMNYGLQRVVGTAFAALVFAVGPVVLAHRAKLSEVAMFALGISFVRMSGNFFQPIGVLVLPRMSHTLGKESEVGVRRDLEILLRAAVLVALFVGLQGAVLSDSLLKVWLGTVPASYIYFFVPLVLFVPFHLAWEVLRSPIDAVSTTAYNNIASTIALAILVAAALVNSSAVLVVGQILSFVVLGSISVAVLSRLYKLKVHPRSWLWPTLFCVAVLPLTRFVDRIFYAKVVPLATYEFVIFGVFIGLLVRTTNRTPPTATLSSIQYAVDATADIS